MTRLLRSPGRAGAAAAARRLQHAPVREHVEADRLVEVRRRADLGLLVVGEHGGAAVAVDRVGDAGGPLDRAGEVAAEGGLGVSCRGVAAGRVEGAAAAVVLAPGDRMVEAHRAAGVGLLVDRGEHMRDAADVAAKLYHCVRALPVLGQRLLAACTRSATLTVACATAERAVARAPSTSVRKASRGSVSIAEWTPTKPPPSR